MSGSENLFRVYAEPADEFGKDGYPKAWHTVKHIVREQAGHRCIRCGHPYRNGEHGTGEWSPCDEHCTHGEPTRCSRYGAITVTPAHREACDGLHEAAWRILTVHHLDGVKANCRWWNLVALDQRCHLSVQSRVVMQRRWKRQHTEWFKPYVAAYYAWSFLGEDLTREQTLAHMDELLALEDQQLEVT